MPPDPSLGETGQDHRGAAARLSVLGGLGRRGHGGFFKENFERWVWLKTLGKLGKCWKKLKKLDTFEHFLMLLSFNGRGHGKI